MWRGGLGRRGTPRRNEPTAPDACDVENRKRLLETGDQTRQKGGGWSWERGPQVSLKIANENPRGSNTRSSRARSPRPVGSQQLHAKLGARSAWSAARAPSEVADEVRLDRHHPPQVPLAELCGWNTDRPVHPRPPGRIRQKSEKRANFGRRCGRQAKAVAKNSRMPGVLEASTR